MSDRRRLLIWGGGGLALAAGVYLLALVFILSPAAELRERIARAREISQGLSAQIDRFADAGDRLGAVGATMLARDRDVFEHRLRAGLSAIATGAGLDEVVVTSTPPRAAANPGASVRMSGGFGALRARLRRQTDFYIVRGRVQGTGTLEEALRTLAMLEGQEWIHRIEGLSLRPVGGDRERVELKVDFGIAMAADLAPRDAGAHAPVASEGRPEALALAGRVAKRGLFRVPPRAPEAAQVQAPQPVEPPKAPPPPYQDWRLAGVMGGTRAEAVLVHRASGKSRVLGAGEGLLGAVFEGGEGERAVFRIGDKRYEVFLGKSLADRRELK